MNFSCDISLMLRETKEVSDVLATPWRIVPYGCLISTPNNNNTPNDEVVA